MKIGLVHFRCGQTDGVSLEMEKQKQVLEELGHEVVFISGEQNAVTGFEIALLNLEEPMNRKLMKNGFEALSDYTAESFEEELNELAYQIEVQVARVVLEQQIDLLIVHNLFSLGINLAAAKALTRVIEKTGIKAISHNHDFYWERERFSRPTSQTVHRFLNAYFPPDSKDIFHIVINSIAQKELSLKRNTPSYVLPNVMDFGQKPWEIDDFNQDFRSRLGISEKDLVFLQATRILPRKAIELAFEFIKVFQESYFADLQTGTRIYTDRKIDKDSKIHFVLCGYAEEMDKHYLKTIKTLAQKMPYSCHFISNQIAQNRKKKPKTYSLWDAYTLADIVTYPSVQEGWGNQLLEAIFAKKIIAGYQYPVLQSDILPKGVRIVSMGRNAQQSEDGLYSLDTQMNQESTTTLYNLITDYAESHRLVEQNFNVGTKYFSFDVLKKTLTEVIDDLYANSRRAAD